MFSPDLPGLHLARSRDFHEEARAATLTAAVRRARRLERLARLFGAGSAWTERRARRYACRARSLRAAGAR